MARTPKPLTEEERLAPLKALERQKQQAEEAKPKGKEPTPSVCIRCGSKAQGNFYSARGDKWHKATGKLCYCKACCNEIYRSYVLQYHQNYNIALYFTCRKIDLPYNDTVYKKAIRAINDPEDSANIENLFSIYMDCLNNLDIQGRSFDDSHGEGDIEGLTSYDAVVKVRRKANKTIAPSKEYEIIEMDVEDLRTKWGNFSNEDLAYLEAEYLDWDAQLNGIHDKYQEINVEQVCLQRNEIRHDRENGEDVTKKLAAFRTLLKDSGLDGLQANEAAQKGVSMTISDIEYHRPVKEVDKDLEDVDGVRLILDAFLGGTSRAVGKENEFTERFDDEYSQYTIDIIDSLANNRHKLSGNPIEAAIQQPPKATAQKEITAPKKRGRPKKVVTDDAKNKKE